MSELQKNKQRMFLTFNLRFVLWVIREWCSDLEWVAIDQWNLSLAQQYGYLELFQNKNLVKTGTWKQKIILQKATEPMILPSNCDHQQWPIQDYQSDDETCTSSAITTSPVSGQPRQFAWPFWPSLPVLPAQLAKNRWTQTKQTSANFNFLFAAINLVSLDIRLRYIQSNLIYVHR